jgi:proteasome lid subunit RPN8/RPN11
MMEHVPINVEIHEAMVAHARFCFPEEACGLIAFDGHGLPRMFYATTNVDRSRVRFTVSPKEHYGAIRHAERRGWTIAGSFHSHPDSAAFPSARDIEGALDPDWLYVIVGMGKRSPDIRGFRIRDSIVTEVAFWGPR